MSFVTAGSPALAPAFRDGDERNDRNDTSAASSTAWALLEALASVGALIDPSGVLAGQRFRRIREKGAASWPPVGASAGSRGSPASYRPDGYPWQMAHNP